MDEGGNALVFLLLFRQRTPEGRQRRRSTPGSPTTKTVTFYEILNIQELYLKITKYHITGFEILYNSGQILF